jgi:hypothetical protein
MISRLVTVSLVALLTFPAIPLTRPDEAGHSPWGIVTVAAKGKPHHGHKQKKHKKQDQKPQVPTDVTRTVRQQVTQTFASTGRTSVPDDSSMNAATFGKAGPYPSTIDVSGFTNGVITDVNLTLAGFTHTSPFDVDVLLSKNDRQALVASDLGDGNKTANVNLTLDDEAASLVPENVLLQSGTFRPTNSEHFEDTFTAPAPAVDGTVALRTFDGADPNGTWQLWVMDNAGGDVGEFASGWALEITAEVDVQVQEPAQTPAPNNDGKHHKRTEGHHGARRREG